MNISAPFVRRPVATSLITLAVLLAGAVAYTLLPVAPLPQVDYPTIQVHAGLPGASPETMASAVATPLERQFGRIAGVNQMTSSSSLGSASVTLQFDINRNIDAAARDVQAAINAARADLPTSLRTNPTYKKVNPADAPILILTLTSDTMTRGDLYDAASTVLAQKLSQVDGIGEVVVGGSSLPAVRVDLIPQAVYKYGIGLEDVRAALASANAHSPKGGIDVEPHDRPARNEGADARGRGIEIIGGWEAMPIGPGPLPLGPQQGDARCTQLEGIIQAAPEVVDVVRRE